MWWDVACALMVYAALLFGATGLVLWWLTRE